MKKLITIIVLTTMCVGAFAQGKVAFVNDSLHAYYLSTDVNKLSAADAGLAGLRTPTGGTLTSGVSLRADLYAGNAADSLVLVSSTSMAAAIAGRQNTANVILPNGIIGGVAAYFQIQIRDVAYATAALAQAGGGYFGYSTIFTAIPGASTQYNSLIQTTTPAFSTWANGAYVIPAGGGFGAIEVGLVAVPEPSSMALAGLGAASLLIFRRRK